MPKVAGHRLCWAPSPGSCLARHTSHPASGEFIPAGLRSTPGDVSQSQPAFASPSLFSPQQAEQTDVAFLLSLLQGKGSRIVQCRGTNSHMQHRGDAHGPTQPRDTIHKYGDVSSCAPAEYINRTASHKRQGFIHEFTVMYWLVQRLLAKPLGPAVSIVPAEMMVGKSDFRQQESFPQ